MHRRIVIKAATLARTGRIINGHFSFPAHFGTERPTSESRSRVIKLHIPNAMCGDQESQSLGGLHGAILDRVF
jgi:hypothetical protein